MPRRPFGAFQCEPNETHQTLQADNQVHCRAADVQDDVTERIVLRQRKARFKDVLLSEKSKLGIVNDEISLRDAKGYHCNDDKRKSVLLGANLELLVDDTLGRETRKTYHEHDHPEVVGARLHCRFPEG